MESHVWWWALTRVVKERVCCCVTYVLFFSFQGGRAGRWTGRVMQSGRRAEYGVLLVGGSLPRLLRLLCGIKMVEVWLF